jgi:hypothetical protein
LATCIKLLKKNENTKLGELPKPPQTYK